MSESALGENLLSPEVIEQIVRYAANAALIGHNVTFSDSWVSEVASGYIDQPEGSYPDRLDPASPLTQTEIDAHLLRVRDRASDNGLYFSNEDRTIVIAPFADDYMDYIKYDWGIGFYDDPDKLIAEYVDRFGKHDITRRTWEKQTATATTEVFKRDSGQWNEELTPPNETLARMRDNLRLLRRGRFSNLGDHVVDYKFQTAELNEGRE